MLVGVVREDVQAEIGHLAHHLRLDHRNLDRGAGYRHRELLAVAQERQFHVGAGRAPHQRGHLVDSPALDRLAVDGQELVALLELRLPGRAPLDGGHDPQATGGRDLPTHIGGLGAFFLGGHQGADSLHLTRLLLLHQRQGLGVEVAAVGIEGEGGHARHRRLLGGGEVVVAVIDRDAHLQEGLRGQGALFHSAPRLQLLGIEGRQRPLHQLVVGDRVDVVALDELVGLTEDIAGQLATRSRLEVDGGCGGGRDRARRGRGRGGRDRGRGWDGGGGGGSSLALVGAAGQGDDDDEGQPQHPASLSGHLVTS